MTETNTRGTTAFFVCSRFGGAPSLSKIYFFSSSSHSSVCLTSRQKADYNMSRYPPIDTKWLDKPRARRTTNIETSTLKRERTTDVKEESNSFIPFQHVNLSSGNDGSSSNKAISIDSSDDEENFSKSNQSHIQTEKIMVEVPRKRPRQSPATTRELDESPIKLFATDQDMDAQHQAGSASHLRHVMSLREMLGLREANMISPAPVEESQMEWIVICNYMIDFDYLLEKVPEIPFGSPRIICFYHTGDPTSWQKVNSENSFAEFCELDPIKKLTKAGRKQYYGGKHHTKLFLIGYGHKLRVIVHTANLRRGDIEHQANAAFIQDFPFKECPTQCESDKNKAEIVHDFEKSLVAYIKTYGFDKKVQWSGQDRLTLMEQLSLYVFSSAKGVLVPSAPGYYDLPKSPSPDFQDLPDFGYMKVKKAILKYIAPSKQKPDTSKYGPLVCQFSSIGGISEKWFKSFISSLSVSGERALHSLEAAVRLVWPTGEDIGSSVQGYVGGGSVPGYLKNLEKPFLKPLFCKWSSSTSKNPIFKSQNVPHIKTYYQLNDDDSFAWFLVGSHNLSKPAWGQEINGQYGMTFKVCAWELGVFLCPELYSNQNEESFRMVPVDGTRKERPGDIFIPLPYHYHPQHYGKFDELWSVERRYAKPDRFGRYAFNDTLFSHLP